MKIYEQLREQTPGWSNDERLGVYTTINLLRGKQMYDKLPFDSLVDRLSEYLQRIWDDDK